MFRNLIGLLAFAAFCTAAKVQVNVYYESLCPDSQAFITQQLYPVMKQGLENFVDIVWIPYGKSTTNQAGQNITFTCHHGPNECYGNKIHACAIRHIETNSYELTKTKESLTLEYINCLMKGAKNFPDSVYPGEKCASEVQINNWRIISECANSTEGDQLLKDYGEKTHQLKPALTSVPTIRFNQQYDPDTQETAMHNFRSALCKYISKPWPKECASESAGVSIHLAPVVATIAFIISRIL